MNTLEAIQAFKQLCSNVNRGSLPDFLTWIKSNLKNISEELDVSRNNADVMFDAVKDGVRDLLPLNGVSSSEQIIVPKYGPNADCDPVTTLHVDAFCYSEDDIDDLCDDGKMSRNYCVDCKSQNIQPLTFISHSASVSQIKYMFKFLLPDLGGKTLVDVGSRTGAVLYGAYLYSASSAIIGVEIDENFCQLQDHIVTQFQFQDRVKILHQDILQCPSLLESADVVILNNVFEFFMPKETQERIWEFLSQHLKRKGTVLITIPSIEESLSNLSVNIDVLSWVRVVDIDQQIEAANLQFYGCEKSEDSDLDQIYVYEVL